MKKVLLILLLLALGLGTAGCQKKEETPAPTATDYVNRFVSAGLPVDNVITYTAESDPNKRLGRPGEYTSKVNFADTRVDQLLADNPEGGTVEVFSSKSDMEKRKEYIESVYAANPLLGNEYFYVSNDGLVLLRLSFSLTPDQAEEYNTILLQKAE